MPETFHLWFWPVLIIIVTLIQIYLQRRPKRLSYRIVNASPVVSIKDKTDKKLTILYDGKEAGEVDVVIIKIVNSGKRTINKTDFEKPVTIVPPPETSILTANLIQSEPKGIEVKYTTDKSGVTIEPLMLNPKDSLVFKLVVSNFEGGIGVHTRIIGVSETLLPIYLEGFRKRMLIPIARIIILLLPGIVGLSVIQSISFEPKLVTKPDLIFVVSVILALSGLIGLPDIRYIRYLMRLRRGFLKGFEKPKSNSIEYDI